MRGVLWTAVLLLLSLSFQLCWANEELIAKHHAENRTCEEWFSGPPIDCLHPREVDCVSGGCTWLPGEPGTPWCQIPTPLYCYPTRIDRISKYISTEFSHAKSHQIELGIVAVFIFLAQVGLIIWSEYYQTRILATQNPRPTAPHKKSDDILESDDVPETILFPSSSSTPTTNTSGNNRSRVKSQKRNEFGNYNSSSKSSSSSSSKESYYQLAPKTPSFAFLDIVNFVSLFIISMGIHLWRLDYPSMLTWDECHFGYFVSKYNAREYLFDIHPPLAKMTFALLGILLGHDPGPNSVYPFKGQMNVPYHNIHEYYHLRLIASFFGSLVAPILYLTARSILLCSPSTAIFTGSLVVYDTLLLMESRGILTDSQLIFWNALAIYCMLALLYRYPDSNYWLVATGFTMGCVFSVKFTALATLGLCGIEACFGFFIVKKPLSFVRCLLAGGIGIGMFLFWWYCHFAILIYNHSEVEWQDSYFQSSLIGNRFHGTLTPPNFFVKTYQLVTTMIRVNAETLEPHYWTTRWYEWIAGTARLSSARGTVAEGKWEMIMMMNPFVTLFTSISVIIGMGMVLMWMRMRFMSSAVLGVSNSEREKRSVGLMIFLVCGWVLNLLPYAGVERSTFVYHYMPGLLYAELMAGVLMDCGFQWHGFGGAMVKGGGKKGEWMRIAIRIGVMSVSVGMLVFGWWFWAPFVYALPLSDEQKANRSFFLFKYGEA